MNFLHIIQSLNAEDKAVLETDDLQFLRCPINKKNAAIHQEDIDAYHYYVLNKKDSLLGQGAFGEVHQAYALNSLTGEVDRSCPVAVKICDDNKFQQDEAEHLSNYYWTEGPLRDNKKVFLITEFLPGKDLMDNGGKLCEEVKKLSFAKRITLMNSIALALNLIHHETPSTSNALIHADLHGSNIRISVDPNTQAINVYILDFGLSKKLVNDDPRMQHKTSLEGKAQYIAPEVLFWELRGIKSDIYALVPIFITILGGKEPFSKKNKLDVKNPDYANADFDFDGIFTGYEIENHPIDIKPFIRRFLEKMQDDAYENRPDSDEVLRFCTTLNNYCALASQPHDAYKDDMLYTLPAKLALLAACLWRYPSNADSPLIDFERFDFQARPEFCKAIIKANKAGMLNAETLSKLYHLEENQLYSETKKLIASVKLTNSDTNIHSMFHNKNKLNIKPFSTPQEIKRKPNGYIS